MRRPLCVGLVLSFGGCALFESSGQRYVVFRGSSAQIEDAAETVLVGAASRDRPGPDVILTGTLVTAAHAAGDLCEDGPHLSKPYQPQQVVEWIKKLRNARVK
jgi:hypothetical protein